MYFTDKKVIAEIRRTAKSAGLTFKINADRTIYFTPYKFCVRGGGETVMSSITLSSAYENTLSGYISSWNGDTFAGVNQ